MSVSPQVMEKVKKMLDDLVKSEPVYRDRPTKYGRQNLRQMYLPRWWWDDFWKVGGKEWWHEHYSTDDLGKGRAPGPRKDDFTGIWYFQWATDPNDAQIYKAGFTIPGKAAPLIHDVPIATKTVVKKPEPAKPEVKKPEPEKPKPAVPKLPDDVADNLLEFQRDHVAKLAAHLDTHQGALDMSDTGAGKTYIAAGLAKTKNMKPVFVTTKGNIKDAKRVFEKFGIKDAVVVNWDSIKVGKVSEFVPKARGEGLKEVRKTTDIIKINKERVNGSRFEWNLPENSLLIFDEGHKAKNPKSINSELVMAAANQGIKSFHTSATLAEKPTDLYAVGLAVGLFKDKSGYFNWCRQYGCENVPIPGKWGAKAFQFTGGDEDLQRMYNDALSKFGERIRKGEVPGFPKSVDMVETYDMGKATGQIDMMQRLYMEDKQLVKRIKEDPYNKDLIKLGIEHGLCNSAGNLYDGIDMTLRQKYAKEIEFLKAQGLADVAKKYMEKGDSVALFVNYKDTANELARLLDTKQLYTGDVKQADAEENQRKFQDNEENVLILTLSKGGQSINLHDIHGGHPRVSLISPSDNARMIKQGFGRVHRAGGQTTALQQVVFAAGTVEEAIAYNLTEKMKNIDIINDGDVDLAELTPNEVSRAVSQAKTRTNDEKIVYALQAVADNPSIQSSAEEIRKLEEAAGLKITGGEPKPVEPEKAGEVHVKAHVREGGEIKVKEYTRSLPHVGPITKIRRPLRDSILDKAAIVNRLRYHRDLAGDITFTEAGLKRRMPSKEEEEEEKAKKEEALKRSYEQRVIEYLDRLDALKAEYAEAKEQSRYQEKKIQDYKDYNNDYRKHFKGIYPDEIKEDMEKNEEIVRKSQQKLRALEIRRESLLSEISRVSIESSRFARTPREKPAVPVKTFSDYGLKRVDPDKVSVKAHNRTSTGGKPVSVKAHQRSRPSRDEIFDEIFNSSNKITDQIKPGDDIMKKQEKIQVDSKTVEGWIAGCINKHVKGGIEPIMKKEQCIAAALEKERKGELVRESKKGDAVFIGDEYVYLDTYTRKKMFPEERVRKKPEPKVEQEPDAKKIGQAFVHARHIQDLAFMFEDDPEGLQEALNEKQGEWGKDVFTLAKSISDNWSSIPESVKKNAEGTFNSPSQVKAAESIMNIIKQPKTTPPKTEKKDYWARLRDIAPNSHNVMRDREQAIKKKSRREKTLESYELGKLLDKKEERELASIRRKREKDLAALHEKVQSLVEENEQSAKEKAAKQAAEKAKFEAEMAARQANKAIREKEEKATREAFAKKYADLKQEWTGKIDKLGELSKGRIEKFSGRKIAEEQHREIQRNFSKLVNELENDLLLIGNDPKKESQLKPTLDRIDDLMDTVNISTKYMSQVRAKKEGEEGTKDKPKKSEYETRKQEIEGKISRAGEKTSKASSREDLNKILEKVSGELEKALNAPPTSAEQEKAIEKGAEFLAEFTRARAGEKTSTTPAPSPAKRFTPTASAKKSGGTSGRRKGGKPGQPNAYWAEVRRLQKTGKSEPVAKSEAEETMKAKNKKEKHGRRKEPAPGPAQKPGRGDMLYFDATRGEYRIAGD